MRVLVTGAAGFLGFALAKRLSEDGHFVICIDNFIRGEDDQAYRELSAKPNVERVDLDLTNQVDVCALPQDVDVVFHMAALNGTQNFYERPFEVMRCCTLPTIFLLERYATSKSLRRFVYAGTSEAYASTVTQFGWPVPTVEDVPLSINDPRNVRWSYGASKMHGEVAVLNAAAAFRTPVSVVRYHNAYGPRMGDKHVIPDFLSRAKQGEFALFGWEDTRSFIYVDDAVEATIRIANAAECQGEIVNVGGVREIRILELAQVMMGVMGWTGEIAKHPSPIGSVKRRAPDTTKLRRLTGFEERWTLEDGLRETARFYVGDQIIAGV